jgi:hypothetical protein
MYFRKRMLLFLLTYSLTLKIEAVCSSETFVKLYQTIRCHVPEDCTLLTLVVRPFLLLVQLNPKGYERLRLFMHLHDIFLDHNSRFIIHIPSVHNLSTQFSVIKQLNRTEWVNWKRGDVWTFLLFQLMDSIVT